MHRWRQPGEEVNVQQARLCISYIVHIVYRISYIVYIVLLHGERQPACRAAATAFRMFPIPRPDVVVFLL